MQRQRPAQPNRKNDDRAYSRQDVSDELLMARYQRGDREAFGSLVKRHRVRVYNVVLRLVQHPAHADELAREVFLRVVQQAGEFKHEARFSTWLYTFARQLCVDHLRRRQQLRYASRDQSPAPDSERTPVEHDSAERPAKPSRVGESLLRAVDALPLDQREVFLLRQIGELPVKEIAEVTGSTEGGVRSRMRAALEQVQQALSEFEEYARELK